MLSVFLRDHSVTATENGSQMVVTKRTDEEQFRQEMMPAWTCMVVARWEILEMKQHRPGWLVGLNAERD